MGHGQRVRSLCGDGRRSVPRARSPTRSGRAARLRSRPGDRVALRARRVDPRLVLAPAPPLPGRERLCRHPAGPGRGRFDGGVPGLPDLVAGADRPRPHPGRRLRVPDRDDLSGQAGRGVDRRGSHPLRRPGRRGVEDVHVHRGRGIGPGDLWGARRLVESVRRQPLPVGT